MSSVFSVIHQLFSSPLPPLPEALLSAIATIPDTKATNQDMGYGVFLA